MAPRWWARLRAALGGYFWLPCPLCGTMFGGHEWHDVGYLSSSVPTDREGGRRGICPRCTAAGYGDLDEHGRGFEG